MSNTNLFEQVTSQDNKKKYINKDFNKEDTMFDLQKLKDMKREICEDMEYELPQSSFVAFNNGKRLMSSLKMTDNIWSLPAFTKHWANIVISNNRKMNGLPQISDDLNGFITIDMDGLQQKLIQLVIYGMYISIYIYTVYINKK